MYGALESSVQAAKCAFALKRQNKLSNLIAYKSRKRFKMSEKPKTNTNDGKEKRRKESILELSKYLEKRIRVKFAGGREASGVLKGYDALLNLVLDNTCEYLRDPDEPFKLAEETRSLGLVVCRGTALVLICPQDGMEAIANPFI